MADLAPVKVHTQQVITFLTEIGIPCKIVEGAADFLPNIRITNGTLENHRLR